MTVEVAAAAADGLTGDHDQHQQGESAAHPMTTTMTTTIQMMKHSLPDDDWMEWQWQPGLRAYDDWWFHDRAAASMEESASWMTTMTKERKMRQRHLPNLMQWCKIRNKTTSARHVLNVW
jgi:hypothetical protein